jgi:hypothetical protein
LAYQVANAARSLALGRLYAQKLLTTIVVTVMKGESANFSLALATSPSELNDVYHQMASLASIEVVKSSQTTTRTLKWLKNMKYQHAPWISTTAAYPHQQSPHIYIVGRCQAGATL